jgi:exonuclease VII large subunit
MARGDLVSSLAQASRRINRNLTEELSQQQQRTRDLAHRLQQLEDESAQHQNSEAGWIK